MIVDRCHTSLFCSTTPLQLTRLKAVAGRAWASIQTQRSQQIEAIRDSNAHTAVLS